jgi:hypothetical protein
LYLVDSGSDSGEDKSKDLELINEL